MTTAATTNFCAEPIDFAGRRLWIDGNSKITAGNGTYDNPSPNAFSLVEVKDCPGSTAVCRAACYVQNLAKHAPDLHSLYAHNSEVIREILALPDPERLLWADVMGTWIERNCQGGFRWHVSGDVFSLDYARFIVEVCRRSPNVNHWIFTRSFAFVGVLVKARNLVVNLSADADNYDDAIECSARYDFLRICYLSHDGVVPTGITSVDVVFPDYSLRGDVGWFKSLERRHRKTVCPVDFHGKSEIRRCGPCARCLK